VPADRNVAGVPVLTGVRLEPLELGLLGVVLPPVADGTVGLDVEAEDALAPASDLQRDLHGQEALENGISFPASIFWIVVRSTPTRGANRR